MSALADLLAAVDGAPVPQQGTNDATKCDYCSSVIHPASRIAVYFATVDYSTGREGSWFLLRLYGECCPRRRVLFPTAHTSEMLLGATFTREQTLVDPEVRDYSATGDGVPYDPIAVFEAITQMPTERQFDPAGMAVGPEDVVDALANMGIDIREYVAADGSIDITPADRRDINRLLERAAHDKLDEYGGMAGLDEQLREWDAKTAKYAEKFGPDTYRYGDVLDRDDTTRETDDADE